MNVQIHNLGDLLMKTFLELRKNSNDLNIYNANDRVCNKEEDNHLTFIGHIGMNFGEEHAVNIFSHLRSTSFESMADLALSLNQPSSKRDNVKALKVGSDQERIAAIQEYCNPNQRKTRKTTIDRYTPEEFRTNVQSTKAKPEPAYKRDYEPTLTIQRTNFEERINKLEREKEALQSKVNQLQVLHAQSAAQSNHYFSDVEQIAPGSENYFPDVESHLSSNDSSSGSSSGSGDSSTVVKDTVDTKSVGASTFGSSLFAPIPIEDDDDDNDGGCAISEPLMTWFREAVPTYSASGGSKQAKADSELIIEFSPTALFKTPLLHFVNNWKQQYNQDLPPNLHEDDRNLLKRLITQHCMCKLFVQKNLTLYSCTDFGGFCCAVLLRQFLALTPNVLVNNCKNVTEKKKELMRLNINFTNVTDIKKLIEFYEVLVVVVQEYEAANPEFTKRSPALQRSLNFLEASVEGKQIGDVLEQRVGKNDDKNWSGSVVFDILNRFDTPSNPHRGALFYAMFEQTGHGKKVSFDPPVDYDIGGEEYSVLTCCTQFPGDNIGACRLHYSIDELRQIMNNSNLNYGVLDGGHFYAMHFGSQKATLQQIDTALDVVCQKYFAWAVHYLKSNPVLPPFSHVRVQEEYEATLTTAIRKNDQLTRVLTRRSKHSANGNEDIDSMATQLRELQKQKEDWKKREMELLAQVAALKEGKSQESNKD